MSKYKVDVTGLDTGSLSVLTSSEMVKLFEKYLYYFLMLLPIDQYHYSYYKNTY